MFSDFIKRDKLIFSLLVGVCFVLIYLVNRLYPLHPDDWEYMYVYSVNSDSTERISGIVDIIRSQYNHYFLWGGRVIAHSIAHVLLMINKEWINILNTIVYLAYIYVIYKYTKRSGTISYLLYAFYFLMLWLFVPSFCSAMLWVTGSANYLYSNLFIFLFMYPFYKYYRYEDEGNKKLKLYLMPLAGLIAGWTNENGAAAMLFFIVVTFILLKLKKQKVPTWAIVGFVFALIGFVLMIKAPGNVNRFILHDRTLDELDLTNPKVFHERYRALSYHFLFSWVRYLSLGYLAMLLIFYLLNNSLIDRKEKRRVIGLSFIFFATAVISFLAMIGSPTVPGRSLFITNTLIIMSMGILFANSDFNIQKYRQILCALGFVALLALFCRDYYYKYSTLMMIDSFWAERNGILEAEKKKGNLDIVFTSSIEADYKFSVAQELSLRDDPDYWTNKRYARYKGVHSVVVKGDSIYNYKYSGVPQYK